MSKLFALLFIFLLTIFGHAQTISPTGSTAPKTSESPEKTDTPQKPEPPAKSGGKFNLPPEKLAPVRIAKFSAAPVIDGKLDDEAWKEAPVLKDFFQTFPGD